MTVTGQRSALAFLVALIALTVAGIGAGRALASSSSQAAPTTTQLPTSTAATSSSAPLPTTTAFSEPQPAPEVPTETVAVQPRMTSTQAIDAFLAAGKVHSWLRRYPAHPDSEASFANGQWTVNVFSGKAGEIATGLVDDVTGAVLEAWTGPQVAWKMARGGPGAFGGRRINSYPVWFGFCAAFLIGLIDWRRPFSLRTLDLLMMLSFSTSLWYFNRGDIFTAMPLAYPGLFWLLGRCFWVGARDRAPRGSVVWPTWLLIGAAFFLIFFRIGLNIDDSNVIDVGYSGVIGAQRITAGETPYGTFPIEEDLPACGPSDSLGEIRERIQANGRCESANPQGDTYGPVAYLAYIPGVLAFGWSGKWDELWSAHATTLLWDMLCVVGLWFVGLRFGGPRAAATLMFAWVAWPLTQYSSSSNTNDMIEPALLVWGFYFLTTPVLRGGFAGLAAMTKFAPLIVFPLWSGYPTARGFRSRFGFVVGGAAAMAASLSVILLDGRPIHAVRTFLHRTFGYQLDRSSVFSLWDWGDYHAKGIPDLHLVQVGLEGALVATAILLFWWPRRRSPLRMAAFTAVLLIGFEIVLTHFSWLYLEWFFPFVAIALLASLPAGERPRPLVDSGSPEPEGPMPEPERPMPEPDPWPWAEPESEPEPGPTTPWVAPRPGSAPGSAS